MRVFIDNGDRTNRNKARLKYLLDAWGFDKFLAAVEAKLGRQARPHPRRRIKPRPAPDRMAHIGVHAQKQPGLNWIGVVLPVGKLTAAQMRGVANLARDLGDGDIRLTVWQNLLISGVPTRECRSARAPHRGHWASPPRRPPCAPASSPAPAVPGCKFAASNTKGTAEADRDACREQARARHCRSTSISPAATIPARSTTSATSA